MDLWPAIDIADGRCVRLRQGDFAHVTSYGDPLEIAATFVAKGATRLHVVDLDAARTGQLRNHLLTVEIARTTGAVVQAGGGIRDFATAEWLLERGISRVVLGTAVVEDPVLVASIARRWPGQVAVGLDHRAVEGSAGHLRNEVRVRGWTTGGALDLDTALGALDGLELAGVVVTDISKDGTGSGPDLAGLAAALARTNQRVIASGGVGTGADLQALSALEVAGRRLDGAIVGRAILSGDLSIESALAACAA